MLRNFRDRYDAVIKEARSNSDKISAMISPGKDSRCIVVGSGRMQVSSDADGRTQ